MPVSAKPTAATGPADHPATAEARTFPQGRDGAARARSRPRPQALQRDSVVPAGRRHGFQRVQRAEIAVTQLQQKCRLALVSGEIHGKAVRNPVRFFAGHIWQFSIQRISDLVDQVLLLLIASLARALMADASPKVGKACDYLRIGKFIVHAGFQSQLRLYSRGRFRSALPGSGHWHNP